MLEGGHGPNASDEILLSRRDDGTLDGAIAYSSQLVLAADDDDALAAFAHETRRHPGLRSFVGRRDRIERFWSLVRAWHRPPSLVRARQPIYVLHPERRAPASGADVRRATLADAERVVEHSAEMMLGELGYDPRVHRASFNAGIRRAIAAGTWWVWIAGDEFRFALHVGARTAATAQLQGVWTPPALRKRGYAFAALTQIAERLLTENRTLSLYVNDFNADAIALYERAGFAPDGEMSTLLFA